MPEENFDESSSLFLYVYNFQIQTLLDLWKTASQACRTVITVIVWQMRTQLSASHRYWLGRQRTWSNLRHPRSQVENPSLWECWAWTLTHGGEPDCKSECPSSDRSGVWSRMKRPQLWVPTPCLYSLSFYGPTWWIQANPFPSLCSSFLPGNTADVVCSPKGSCDKWGVLWATKRENSGWHIGSSQSMGWNILIICINLCIN